MSTHGPEELANALSKVPDTLLRRIIERLRRHVAAYLHTVFPQQRLSGPPGLRRRTGDLARSFDFTMTGSTWEDWTLVEFSRSKYARAHEEGAVIRPKSSRFLAIPIPGSPAQTVSGVSRGGPRSFANTFVWRRGNQAIIAQRVAQKRQTKLLPLFVLKPQITLRPRLGFYDSWRADQANRQREIEQAAGEALGDV